MRAAGPARTLFTSLRWDCRFWALTWLKQPWRSPERRPTPGGLFHTFDGDERTRYLASLASVTKHDGTLYVLCFSDDGPDTGPHPISQEELRTVFNPSNGWDVAAIEPDRIQTRYHDDGAPAWFATINRI